MKNYWKMSDFSLFAVPYAYVDHSSYLADQLFVQNKITMKFKGEMVKDGSAYCIVFCKVLKIKCSYWDIKIILPPVVKLQR